MTINIGDTGTYTSYPISPYTGLPVWYCKVLEIHDEQLDVEIIVTNGLIKKTINKTDFDKKLILWDGVRNERN